MWLIFAILNAFCESGKDVSSKFALRRSSKQTLVWALMLYSAVLNTPLLINEPIPSLSLSFVALFLLFCILLTIALYLYVYALSVSELSLVLPLIMFTPMFMLVTSPLIVGQYPTALGYVGVLLIVVGSYYLRRGAERRTWWEPIVAVVQDRGARAMLLVAFIWSLTSNIDRVGMDLTTPYSWLVMVQWGMVLLSYPIFVRREPDLLRNTLRQTRTLFLPGVLQAAMAFCHVTAVSTGVVVYVIAIKRTSVLFSILLSGHLFREQHLRQRFAGALIMLAGLVCILCAA